MTKSKHRARWIVGPIAYTSTTGFVGSMHAITAYGFNFVAGTRGGQLRRYRLIYNVRTRVFSGNTMQLTDEDRANEKRLLALYMPISVRRDDLPDGGIAVALKAMLTAEDLAALTAASIRSRDLFSKGDDDA